VAVASGSVSVGIGVSVAVDRGSGVAVGSAVSVGYGVNVGFGVRVASGTRVGVGPGTEHPARSSVRAKKSGPRMRITRQHVVGIHGDSVRRTGEIITYARDPQNRALTDQRRDLDGLLL